MPELHGQGIGNVGSALFGGITIREVPKHTIVYEISGLFLGRFDNQENGHIHCKNVYARSCFYDKIKTSISFEGE